MTASHECLGRERWVRVCPVLDAAHTTDTMQVEQCVDGSCFGGWYMLSHSPWCGCGAHTMYSAANLATSCPPWPSKMAKNEVRVDLSRSRTLAWASSCETAAAQSGRKFSLEVLQAKGGLILRTQDHCMAGHPKQRLRHTISVRHPCIPHVPYLNRSSSPFSDSCTGWAV